MSEKSKIEIAIGEFKFTGEGEEKWLAHQLDKILDKAQALVKLAPPRIPIVDGVPSKAANAEATASPASVPLAKFLSQNNATSNQVKKFLGAAVWLSVYKGKTSLVTGDVTTALKEAGQTRVGNASDCLAKSIKKGHAERDGSGFMVTVHGKEEFGIND